MSHDDFEKEPIPGLPAHLPEGENILWQGAPDQAAFLRKVLNIRLICLYFALVFVWNVGTAFYDGRAPMEIALTAAWTAALCGIVYAMGYWFAGAVARSTMYTITNKRVVMRFGVAIPVTFNLPFTQITSADVKMLDGDSGTISLSLKEHTKISWAILWPHARPWKVGKPCPALRAVGDASTAAQVLSDALRAAHGQERLNLRIAKPGKAEAAPSFAGSARPVGAMSMDGI
ncbi:MAG: photosynthetic complex putative assembly protein PuhB [Pseudomonadota bacterium]